METDNGKPVSPMTLGIRLPSWALFEGWWEDSTYIGPKKCVTVSPDWDLDLRKDDGKYFYTNEDRQAIIQMREDERQDPEKFKVERRGHFSEVINSYLDAYKVDRAFQGIPIQKHEGEPIEYRPLATNRTYSTYMHKYYAHLDPSSTTAGFGFALGHVEPIEIDGRVEDHVVFDIIQRWNPADFPDSTIDWDPILEEVIELCATFYPQQLTMDQHQSSWPISYLRKMLMKKNLSTRVFEKTATSMNNWNRAEIFKTAINRNLIHAPNDTADCQYAALELKFLQEIKSARIPRVEKQDVGPIQTKDIADAMMEVVEACIGNSMANQMRGHLSEGMAMGSQGGYGMRGSESARSSEIAQMYNHRSGEQRFTGGMASNKNPVSPTRRPIGGKPVYRRLPNR